uniref:formin-binding protein 4-like isoform X2 n=1 Tax=Ciona intestinalis TaxID=7719 RepID=UPI00089DCC6B|nr:formin-binding protein 4-like isoform X2 [Ciona intestinalis]|eukprot:XP_018667349.1 formin-binding protein 4-like isoform X2 [Ciona intestinalis]
MSRRKPKLQIGSGHLNRNTPDDNLGSRSMKQKSKTSGGAGLGLLGSYGGDSDEGTSSSDSEDQHLPRSSLDTKVADFLKEIDDIAVDSPTDGKTTKAQNGEDKKKIDKTKIKWGPWSECFDENTKHPYYWNTETNEVTWIVPPEIEVQIQPKEVVKEVKAKEPSVDDMFAGFMNEINEEMVKIDENKQQNRTTVSNDGEVTHVEATSNAQRRVRERDSDSDIIIPTKRRKSPNTVEEIVNTNANESTDVNKVPTLSENNIINGISNSSPKSDKEDMDRSTEEAEIKEQEDQIVKEVVEQKEPIVKPQVLEAMEECYSDDSFEVESQTEDNVTTTTITTIDAESQTNPSSPAPTKPTVHTSTQTEQAANNETMKTSVGLVGATLLQKLEFLDISKSAIMDFHLLLVEIEVRLADWKSGELSDEYTLTKLKEAEVMLQKYEQNAMPKDWTCQWDSQHKRYYYQSKKSGKVQWEYPEMEKFEKLQAMMNKDENTVSDTSSKNEESSSSSNKTSNSTEKTSSATVATDKSLDNQSFQQQPGYNMQNYSYWAAMQNQYRMHYPYMVNDAYASPMQSNSPGPSNEDAAPRPPVSDKPPLPPPPGDDNPPPPPPSDPPEEGEIADDGIEMEISDTDEPAEKSTIEHQPVTEVQRGPVDYKAVVASAPVKAVFTSVAKPPTLSVLGPTVGVLDKIKKTKKVKKTSTKKPPKQMVGMVAKWQKAKMEIEEEEKRLIKESEEDLDREVDVKKKIVEWRREQFKSGKAASNANFQPIGDDWKKRVKQRKQRIT